uniref:UBX domain-containing protein n=1 Tax=Globisporangium ultimum (strain ATCC 200006 / CBS 805.95 / DAOM BR144) TaxID=431595 RepID=K3X5G1_GLOUD
MPDAAPPPHENRDAPDEATGLRRRPVAAADASLASSESATASSSASPSSSRAAATSQRRRKGFVELLFSPLSFVLGDGEPEDPQVSARAFTHALRRRYGDVFPRFEHTSFRDAVSTARTASKFLLVFLHSNIHDDADAFCRDALCTEQLSTYLNDSDCIVSWAGCVQHAEGFGVSLSLGCATFPFLALLTCVSRGVNVVEKITTNLPADQIIRRLESAVDRNTQILATARRQHQQRSEAQLLREQQDREYQESLAADRQREEEARLQEQRLIEEQLRAEQEAREKEEEERRQAEAFQQTMDAKRARLADAPPSRVPPPGADYKTAVLKFHLHNGTRLERVFYAHDTLQTVRDFIDVQFFDREIKITNYELATNFPKKTYGPDLLDLTLQEVGLAPQALVFVQDLDS